MTPSGNSKWEGQNSRLTYEQTYKTYYVMLTNIKLHDLLVKWSVSVKYKLRNFTVYRV